MACFVKYATYKAMGFPLLIQYIDTAGNVIKGIDGLPMTRTIDLTKTPATTSDGYIDLKDAAYAEPIAKYEFTNSINTSNSEESKILFASDGGTISGINENRKVTLGSFSGYMLRFIKYSGGNCYVAMGNRNSGNVFQLTGKPIVYLTYKRTVSAGIEIGTLNVGDKVKSDGSVYYGQPITWLVIGKDHDADNTVSLLSENILTLKCFDAAEPNNRSGSYRWRYGNNRYLYSNLLQWLNSDAEAGKWYSAKYAQDQMPDSSNVYSTYNSYDTQAGFLNGFSRNFKDSLVEIGKTTAKDTEVDGGGSETVTAKVHLLSNTEVGLANENKTAEGKIYEYFSKSNTNTQRLAYPTAEAVRNNMFKSDTLNTALPWMWWLRTPVSGNASRARAVNTDGSLSYGSAYNGYFGARPLVVLPSSTLLNETPDADGTYIMQI